MFKKNIRLLTEDWGFIEEYNSSFKPNVNEFVYSDKLNKYFIVLRVIHTIKSGKLLVIVDEYENKIEKNL